MATYEANLLIVQSLGYTPIPSFDEYGEFDGLAYIRVERFLAGLAFFKKS